MVTKTKDKIPSDKLGHESDDSYVNDLNSKRKANSKDNPQSALSNQETAAESSDNPTGETNDPGLNYYKSNTGSDSPRNFKNLISSIRGASRLKKGLGAGALLGIIVSAVLISSIASGPLQFLQLASLLGGIHFTPAEAVSTSRIRKAILYAEYAKSLDGLENTRLGRVEAYQANKIVNKLEASGIKSVYDNGRFVGLDIDQSKMPDYVKSDLKGLNKDIDPDGAKRKTVYAKHFKTTPGNIVISGGTVSISEQGTINNRRLLSRALSISPDFNVATAAMSKRKLYKRANISLNAVTRVEQAALQGVADKYKEWREQRSLKLSGKDPSVNVAPKTSEGDDRIDSEFNDAQKEGKSNVDKIKIGAKAGGGAVAVIGALCLVHDVSGEAANLQKTNRLMPMMQVAAEALTVASKIQEGQDVDLATIGEFALSLNAPRPPNDIDPEELNDPESDIPVVGGSGFSASTIRKEMGEQVDGRTFDKVPEANPDSQSNVAAVDDFFNNLQEPLKGSIDYTCRIFNNVGSWFEAGINYATFGAYGTIQKAVLNPLVDFMFGVLAGGSPDFSKMRYAGDPYVEAASVGALAMANEEAMTKAQPVLSEQEASDMMAYSRDYKLLNDDRSLFAKIFRFQDYDSIAGRLAIGISSRPLVDNILRIPSTITSGLGGAVGVAKAADSGTNRYDYYGMPRVGIHPALLEFESDSDNINYENPYQNVLDAKKHLAERPELKEYIEKCHKITINESEVSATTLGVNEAPLSYLFEENGCQDGEDGGRYLATNLNYTPIKRDNSVIDYVASVFSPTAHAIESDGPINLSADQIAYYSVMFALTDTSELMSYSCVYEGDTQSCEDIIGPIENGDLVEDGVQFRVGTLNLLGNRYTVNGTDLKDGKYADWPSGEKRVKEAFKLIQENNLSVVGLQELEPEQRAGLMEVMGDNWGIHPNPADYKDFASPNSIIWDKTVFDETGSKGYAEDLVYLGGDKMNAPWIDLRHKASGETVHIQNTHDPVYVDDNETNAKRRYQNAVAHRDNALERINNGEKVIIVGDFNSNLTLRSPQDDGIDKDQLTYCVLTKTGKIRNAYDAEKGITGTCPTTINVAIDHVYVSQNIGVNRWERISGLLQEEISDHPIIYATVVIGSAATAEGWTWPISKADYVTINADRCFDPNPPAPGHTGVDIAVNNKPVYAANSGIVVEAENGGDAGNYVMIDHQNGYFSNYQHLSSIKVAPKQSVSAGQQIGITGNTGYSTGPHLHFSVTTTAELNSRSNTGSAIEPTQFLPKDRPNPCIN
jgi:hypothetical protein